MNSKTKTQSIHKAWGYVTLLLAMTSCLSLQAQIINEQTGREIMDEVYRRHQQFPYVYEEQSMVLVDRNGYRDTRKARRYSRVEEDGSVKFMYLFDSPEEVKGVALLASRDSSGHTTKFVYLPAFGPELIESSGNDGDGNFLGTDFSIENITGEIIDNYQYVRRHDRMIQDTQYFSVDVFRVEDDPGKNYPLRRHYIRADNFYICKTEHYDRRGRVYKKQSHHDLKQVDGEMWRASMILMEDIKENHRSLIKIDRRIFSHDYVPEEIFSAEWLYENHPFKAPDENTAGLVEDSKNIDEVVTTPIDTEGTEEP